MMFILAEKIASLFGNLLPQMSFQLSFELHILLTKSRFLIDCTNWYVLNSCWL